MRNRELTRFLTELIRPLKTRVAMMLAKGVVRMVDDERKMQTLQLSLLAGETKDGIERYQTYGFTSVPLPGAEHVTLFPGGDRTHGLTIAVDDRRYRLKGLKGGELALYSDENQSDHGHRIHFRRGGQIEVIGRDLLVKASNTLRLEAHGIEIAASGYYQQEVHGKGFRETWSADVNYRLESWTRGAVSSSAEHGLNQPELDSSHPEGGG